VKAIFPKEKLGSDSFDIEHFFIQKGEDFWGSRKIEDVQIYPNEHFEEEGIELSEKKKKMNLDVGEGMLVGE